MGWPHKTALTASPTCTPVADKSNSKEAGPFDLHRSTTDSKKPIPTPPLHGAVSVGGAIRSGASLLVNSKTPNLDARVLLKNATGFDDLALIANAKDVLPAEKQDLFFKLVKRRASGEPVAYITGIKEFWSLPFKVTPDVLIPRGDSECLIEAAVNRRTGAGPWSIIDLGTGSGCLLCALLSEFPMSAGFGVDRSPAAIRVARENARALGQSGRASFFAGDWLRAVGCQFDVVIANPPYIRDRDRAALPHGIAAFEPASALDAGPHGFDSYEQIFQMAPGALKSDGLFIIEAGDDQAAKLAALARRTFPSARVERVNDLQGFARAIVVDLAP